MTTAAVHSQSVFYRRRERSALVQGQRMSGQGVYPGYLLQQGLQYLQHHSLPSPYCLPLQSLQPLQLPSSLYSYPSPYLGQAVSGGQGEEQEVSPSLHTPREPNRDTSLSPRLEVPGEQEERDDYLAELAREREVLQSRGGREAVNNVLRILERGTDSPPDHDTCVRRCTYGPPGHDTSERGVYRQSSSS